MKHIRAACGIVLTLVGLGVAIVSWPGVIDWALTTAKPPKKYHYYYTEDLRTPQEVVLWITCGVLIAVIGVWITVRSLKKP